MNCPAWHLGNNAYCAAAHLRLRRAGRLPSLASFTLVLAPHARGTLKLAPQPDDRGRFSPARTGNTLSLGPRAIAPTLQPRTRGERSAIKLFLNTNFASAPHARGTLSGKARARGVHRFSPARAGNTEASSSSTSSPSLQPRTRGEHLPWNSTNSAVSASAPHARGTRLGADLGPCRWRFSPARAGNTILCVR